MKVLISDEVFDDLKPTYICSVKALTCIQNLEMIERNSEQDTHLTINGICHDHCCHDCYTKDYAAKLIEALRKNTHITHITLTRIEQFGPDEWTSLAKIFGSSEIIVSVDLYYTTFDDAALTVLCDALKQNSRSKLEELCLVHTDIRSDGVPSLKEVCAITNSVLSKIDLRCNIVSDDDLLSLYETMGNKPDSQSTLFCDLYRSIDQLTN